MCEFAQLPNDRLSYHDMGNSFLFVLFFTGRELLFEYIKETYLWLRLIYSMDFFFSVAMVCLHEKVVSLSMSFFCYGIKFDYWKVGIEFWLVLESWSHPSFVNVSPTVENDISMNKSAQVLQYENPKINEFLFKKCRNWNLTCAEELYSP